MASKEYNAEQMKQARQVADALLQVSAGKRSIFTLMIEAMLIGAEMAENQMIATQTTGSGT